MHARTLLLVALLAGCGGGGSFEGEAEAPGGYATYEGHGVSIAHPEGWSIDDGRDADGGWTVEITPPEQEKTPYGLIRLSSVPDAEDRFDSSREQRRTVIESVTKGEIESDEEVDVPGAKEAHRLTATVPPGQGTDPVEVKSDSLDLLRDDGDSVTVIVAAPRRDGDELDPAAVVESLRLAD
jgi:hypothetical protein